MDTMALLKRQLRRLCNKSLLIFGDWHAEWVYRLWGIEGVNRILQECPPAFVGGLLIRFGAHVNSDHDLNSPLLIHNAVKDYSKLTIGKQCHLGKDVFLDLRDLITIEDQGTISMRTTILTHVDMGRSPLSQKEFPPGQAPVVIKRGAFIGAGAIILKGVTIGECAVIQAGAVVNKDVPPFSISGGVPAKVVRYLHSEQT